MVLNRYFLTDMRFERVVLMLIVALLPLCAVAKKKQANIEFAQASYNFGNVPEKGGKVSHTFEFTNTGDANLVIIDARADCGCTVPEFPTKPIAPGAKGSIKVTFDPVFRPGSFTKVVTVHTNAKQKKTRVKITGIVNPNK